MLAKLVLCAVVAVALAQDSVFGIGRGIYDITGPAAEASLMGYAKPGQNAAGILQRLRARAFIFVGANGKRVVFVNIDACMGSQLVHLEVLSQLEALYGDLYNVDNVAISGTHTHSGPGGFFQYVMFNIPSIGFIRESMDALVDGIVQAIVLAHNSIQPGNLLLAQGDLYDANINRSPSAYLNNPASERAQYNANTDSLMTLLKLVSTGGEDLGLIDWFSVHGTSVNNTNKFINGDNKGFASYLFEQTMNGNTSVVWPGHGDFVAAFAQTSSGDVSPNTNGPHCLDTGLPCDVLHSTCNGRNELCVASGPGANMYDSAQIIGTKQFELAELLYNMANITLTGNVDYRHIYVNMSDVTVNVNGVNHTTCLPAMGYAFAAGTTDGPGEFNFEQGSNSSNPFWNFVSDILEKPTQAQIDCQAPKPILLDTGQIPESKVWHDYWQPQIVDLGLLQIGQFVIIVTPGEFTTMSGRRLRAAVLETLIANGFPNDTVVVIAGLANTYADYITTFEEYQIQRYEAGSTIFGPYTLLAYTQNYVALAEALATGATLPPGPTPVNLLDELVELLPPVVEDKVPAGKSFGEVHTDALPSYQIGEVAQVSFWSSNPRSNRTTQGTYLTVEQAPDWNVVLTDGDWSTVYAWEPQGALSGESLAVISWNITTNTSLGEYRIRHFGSYKKLGGELVPFSGTSSTFKVVA